MNAYREVRSLEYPGMIVGAPLPDVAPEPTAWSEIKDGYRTKTIKRGNCTIVIRRPVLDEKEAAKRMRAVEIALSNYGKSK